MQSVYLPSAVNMYTLFAPLGTYIEINDVARLNSEALRKLVKKHDKRKHRELFSSILLPELYFIDSCNWFRCPDRVVARREGQFAKAA